MVYKEGQESAYKLAMRAWQEGEKCLQVSEKGLWYKTNN